MTPLAKSGLVLGIGLGAFLDGIVLHQIAGWHHLICRTETCVVTTAEALQRQNSEDGYFHLAAWVLTATGVALLFRAARSQTEWWTGRLLVGAMLAGWGLFNFVEGVIDHHILEIHHVRPGHPHEFAFDMAFLGSALALILVGAGLVRSSARERQSGGARRGTLARAM